GSPDKGGVKSLGPSRFAWVVSPATWTFREFIAVPETGEGMVSFRAEDALWVIPLTLQRKGSGVVSTLLFLVFSEGSKRLPTPFSVRRPQYKTEGKGRSRPMCAPRPADPLGWIQLLSSPEFPPSGFPKVPAETTPSIPRPHFGCSGRDAGRR